MKNQKERLYKENAVQEDLYHFEMGNELGAHLEKHKEQFEKTYRTHPSAEDNMNKQNKQNNEE